MNREKILKIAIIVTGLFCLTAFISIRFLPLYNLLLTEDMVPEYWDKTKYGELYYFSHIKYFKEEGIPPAQTKFQHKPKHSSLNKSDIIAFGDSYFDFSRNTQFPERLSDSLDARVHFKKGDYILSYLEEHKYDTTKPRVLIYERTERWIPIMWDKPPNDDFHIDTRSDIRKTIAEVRDQIFNEQSEILYDALLKRSVVTEPIYAAIATLKFDVFDYISPYTPKYYLKDTVPWLFYYDQLNDEPTSFYYEHSDKEIADICNNLSILSNTLSEKYNIRLVFLPLPAKYTLYHQMLNNHKYNNFIPRLYDCLNEKDILYVNVFDDYKNADELVYFGTDEHWTETGISIAFEETMAVLKSDSITKNILFNPSKNTN